MNSGKNGFPSFSSSYLKGLPEVSGDRKTAVPPMCSSPNESKTSRLDLDWKEGASVWERFGLKAIQDERVESARRTAIKTLHAAKHYHARWGYVWKSMDWVHKPHQSDSSQETSVLSMSWKYSVCLWSSTLCSTMTVILTEHQSQPSGWLFCVPENKSWM